jgi:preprotein translocase subunit SecF
VVFDKVRENTLEIEYSETRTFGEMVNLAVNQTLVRSVNTSVVAVLPVGSILFIGSLILGAGTLRDIALALFVGTIVGTYSSIFLAAPIYVHLRENEAALKAAKDKVVASRA